MPENESLLLKLCQSVDRYSRAQQRLGEFVLSDPIRVVYLTTTELACESDTSEVSVTRLCRTLGCRGYDKPKMALTLSLQQIQSVEYGGDEIDNMVSESVQALRDIAKLPDRILLEVATLALRQAQSVQIHGVTASAILGEYLHYKFLRLRESARLFSDMHRATMSTTTLSKNTFMVAISSSGSTCDLLHVVKLTRKQGVHVSALSNAPRNPLASLNDIRLVTAKPEGPLNAGALNARVGAILLVELLTTSLITLDHKYSNVSQQTVSATLPLLL